MTALAVDSSARPHPHKCAHSNAFLRYALVSKKLLNKWRDRFIRWYNLVSYYHDMRKIKQNPLRIGRRAREEGQPSGFRQKSSFEKFAGWTPTRVSHTNIVSCGVDRLLFADDLVLPASSEQSLYLALDRFSAACNRPEWKSALEDQGMFLQKTRHCRLQVKRQYTAAGRELKFFGLVFTSDGRRNRKIDISIGKTNAVLRELYPSVFTKREASNIEKLSLFISVFVPIFT